MVDRVALAAGGIVDGFDVRAEYLVGHLGTAMGTAEAERGFIVRVRSHETTAVAVGSCVVCRFVDRAGW